MPHALADGFQTYMLGTTESTSNREDQCPRRTCLQDLQSALPLSHKGISSEQKDCRPAEDFSQATCLTGPSRVDNAGTTGQTLVYFCP